MVVLIEYHSRFYIIIIIILLDLLRYRGDLSLYTNTTLQSRSVGVHRDCGDEENNAGRQRSRTKDLSRIRSGRFVSVGRYR